MPARSCGRSPRRAGASACRTRPPGRPAALDRPPDHHRAGERGAGGSRVTERSLPARAGAVRLAAGQHGDLRAELRPLLRTLSTEINETVDLSVLIRARVSFIDQVAAPHRLRAVSAVGASFPAHCTANGKALLACYSDASYASSCRAAPGGDTGTRTPIARGCSRSWDDPPCRLAIDREEHTVGICAIGAAVRMPRDRWRRSSVPVPDATLHGQRERRWPMSLLRRGR